MKPLRIGGFLDEKFPIRIPGSKTFGARNQNRLKMIQKQKMSRIEG